MTTVSEIENRISKLKFKIRVYLRVPQVPITKKGHCLEFFVTAVKRENSLEPFLSRFFSLPKVKEQFLNVSPESILVRS